MFPFQSLVSISFVASSFFACQCWAKTAAEWKEYTIYQVITDRFALSDGSSPSCDSRSYCGGTWQGIENKLDYIQGMGFNAVWISPVIHNIEDSTDSGYAYHGYWGDNPFELNPHFGTADDLLSLSAAIHSRGMSLMLDVVINHLTSNTDSASVDYGSFPAPFNTASAFHQPPCAIDYSDQSSVEDCWLILGPPPCLPDINTEDATVLSSIIDSVVTLVQTYSFDGIRLDTTKHLPQSALAQFQDAVSVFVAGEAYDSRINYVASYQGPLDATINYPLYWPVIAAFNTTSPGPMSEIASTISQEQYWYHDTNVLPLFLDNPDQPRFASVSSSSLPLAQNALTLTFLHSGIPVVYYGLEQSYLGAADPDNRGGLWWSSYNTSSPLYAFIRHLNQIRGVAKSENDASFFSRNASVVASTDNYLALERGPLLAVVTNIAATPSYSVDEGYAIPNSQFADGDTLLDLLTCQNTTVGQDGAFTSAGNNGLPRVWVSSSTFSHPTLC